MSMGMSAANWNGMPMQQVQNIHSPVVQPPSAGLVPTLPTQCQQLQFQALLNQLPQFQFQTPQLAQTLPGSRPTNSAMPNSPAQIIMPQQTMQTAVPSTPSAPSTNTLATSPVVVPAQDQQQNSSNTTHYARHHT